MGSDRAMVAAGPFEEIVTAAHAPIVAIADVAIAMAAVEAIAMIAASSAGTATGTAGARGSDSGSMMGITTATAIG
jgi:hypothetical protein